MVEVKYIIAATLLFFGIPYVTWAEKATPKILETLGDEEEELSACISLFKPQYADNECCQSISKFTKFDIEFKECAKSDSSDEWECADFECVFRKMKALDAQGKIIDEKIKSMFDEVLKENPKGKKIVDRVTKECLNGQYEEYPPDEDCSALKFHVCAYTNIMLECESWKDTKECNELNDLAKECRAAIDGN